MNKNTEKWRTKTKIICFQCGRPIFERPFAPHTVLANGLETKNWLGRAHRRVMAARERNRRSWQRSFWAVRGRDEVLPQSWGELPMKKTCPSRDCAFGDTPFAWRIDRACGEEGRDEGTHDICKPVSARGRTKEQWFTLITVRENTRWNNEKHEYM